MHQSQSELYEIATAAYDEARGIAGKATQLYSEALSHGAPYEVYTNITLQRWAAITRELYDHAGLLRVFPQQLLEKAVELEALASQILGLRSREVYARAREVRDWAAAIPPKVERVIRLADEWQSEQYAFADIIRQDAEDSASYWAEFGEYDDDW